MLLNDHNPTIVARNLLLLLLLGMIPDMESAVELALHFWYTIMLPMEYNIYLQCILTMVAECYQDDGTLDISIGRGSKVRAKLQSSVFTMMLSMVTSRYGLQEANAEIDRVQLGASLFRSARSI